MALAGLRPAGIVLPGFVSTASAAESFSDLPPAGHALDSFRIADYPGGSESIIR